MRLNTLYVLTLTSSIIFAQTFSDRTDLLLPSDPPFQNSGHRGSSAADFNNDGRVDLYHANFTHPGRLYLNLGEEGFVDVLGEIDLDEGTNMWGAAFGDYNNDSYFDIMFQDLSAPSKIYLNNRDMTFTEVNDEVNVQVKLLAQGAAWADFNLDGTLDFVIVNDIGPNQLFKNLDFEVFEDISVEANVQTVGNSYGVSWGDINQDGYPDFYISTCHGSDPLRSINHLLLNNGDETFTNIAHQAGVADSLPGWGVLMFDYDNDADIDIYCTNSHHPPRIADNRLYRNDGNNTFHNASSEAGVRGGDEENSYGNAVADFDNDGWQDIYVTNLGQRDRLYRNNGDGTFTDIAEAAGIEENEHRTVSVGDFNDDGWIDIFTAGEPDNILMYNNGGSNKWLRITARGIEDNYHGIGTRIELWIGGMIQVREIQAGSSFCSQHHSVTAHFGLGSASIVDSLILRWPNGTTDIYTDMSHTNQHIILVQGIGAEQRPDPFSLLQPEDETQHEADVALSFSWEEPDDPDVDTLTYNLYMRGVSLDDGSAFDTIFTDISTPNFSLLPGTVPDNFDYRWSVDANDDYSTTATGRSFTFRLLELTDIESSSDDVPTVFALHQNYPNPFNPTTTIEWQSPVAGWVELAVYDISGQRIRTLVNGTASAGQHHVEWDSTNEIGLPVVSGVYVYRLSASSGFVQTKKMVLLR